MSVAEPLTAESPMPFGAFTGEALKNVEPSYLLVVGESELVKQTYPGLSRYIEDNRDTLELAAADKRRERDEEEPETQAS